MVLFAVQPQVTVSGWIPWVIAVGSLCGAGTAIVVFFRKVAIPFAEVVATMRQDFPVWVAIAERYGLEGRETLTAEIQSLVSNGETLTEIQQHMLDRLEGLDTKLSDTRHDIIGDIASLKAGPAGARTLIDRLEQVSRDLQQVQARLDAPPEDP